MKIGLIGAGRLGICLALLIEKAGYEVLASDNRVDYINSLQKGMIDTAEPEVQQYLSNAKNIEFTTDNLRVISECDLIFTLVATPSLADGSYDVSAVWKVINDFKDIPILLDEKSLVIGCTTKRHSKIQVLIYSTTQSLLHRVRLLQTYKMPTWY